MKKKNKKLYTHLVKLGWSDDIAKDVSKAYMKNSIQGVVKASEWMNDKQHDYTHAITMDVASWYLKPSEFESLKQNKQNKEGGKKGQPVTIIQGDKPVCDYCTYYLQCAGHVSDCKGFTLDKNKVKQ